MSQCKKGYREWTAGVAAAPPEHRRVSSAVPPVESINVNYEDEKDMESCFLILTPDNIRNMLSTFKLSREKDLAQDFANIGITLGQYSLGRSGQSGQPTAQQL
jgi:hypothetical protein